MAAYFHTSSFPHASDNLFQIHFNNFLWRFSKTSSAKQPKKGMGLAPAQHIAEETVTTSPLPWRQTLGHRQLYLRKLLTVIKVQLCERSNVLESITVLFFSAFLCK